MRKGNGYIEKRIKDNIFNVCVYFRTPLSKFRNEKFFVKKTCHSQFVRSYSKFRIPSEALQWKARKIVMDSKSCCFFSKIFVRCKLYAFQALEGARYRLWLRELACCIIWLKKSFMLFPRLLLDNYPMDRGMRI